MSAKRKSPKSARKPKQNVLSGITAAEIDVIRDRAYHFLDQEDEGRRSIGRILLATWAAAKGKHEPTIRDLSRRACSWLRTDGGIRVTDIASDGTVVPNEITIDDPHLSCVTRRLRKWVEYAAMHRKGELPKSHGDDRDTDEMASDLAFSFAFEIAKRWSKTCPFHDTLLKLDTHFKARTMLDRDAEREVCAALRVAGVPESVVRRAFNAEAVAVTRQKARRLREGTR